VCRWKNGLGGTWYQLLRFFQRAFSAIAEKRNAALFGSAERPADEKGKGVCSYHFKLFGGKLPPCETFFYYNASLDHREEIKTLFTKYFQSGLKILCFMTGV
jgi:hypothetical protein